MISVGLNSYPKASSHLSLMQPSPMLSLPGNSIRQEGVQLTKSLLRLFCGYLSMHHPRARGPLESDSVRVHDSEVDGGLAQGDVYQKNGVPLLIQAGHDAL